MNVIVNGTPHTPQAATLAALLRELGYDDASVATARNRAFVRRKDRATTQLADGDEIEILTPRQGG